MDLTRIDASLRWLPLVVSLAIFVIHIFLHHLITAYMLRSSRRKDADYIVWWWISTGFAIGWLAVFWDVMPLGEITIHVLVDADTTKRLMTAYMTSHIAILPYQWISSILFAEAPVTRLVRKTVPAAMIAYGVLLDTKPSTIIMIVSWALRHCVLDMFIDAGVMESIRRTDGKFVKVMSGACLFMTIQLFVSFAIPVFEPDHARPLKLAMILYAVCELAFELQPVPLV